MLDDMSFKQIVLSSYFKDSNVTLNKRDYVFMLAFEKEANLIFPSASSSSLGSSEL